MRRVWRAEVGAAVTDFVMTTALLTFMFLALLQLGFTLHIRNTLTSAAAEGARYGARLDSGPGWAVDRATGLISSAVSPRYAQNVSAHVETSGGASIMVVDVQAPVPAIGRLSLGQVMDVRGRALMETQP